MGQGNSQMSRHYLVGFIYSKYFDVDLKLLNPILTLNQQTFQFFRMAFQHQTTNLSL